MEKFFAAIQNMFKVPELRKRIFFTLGILAIYRLGAHVTAPGINKVQLEQVWGQVSGTLLGVLDLFSGGNFRTISVFALGVTPYITASIIIQLMTVLSAAQKDSGRRRSRTAENQPMDALSDRCACARCRHFSSRPGYKRNGIIAQVLGGQR